MNSSPTLIDEKKGMPNMFLKYQAVAASNIRNKTVTALMITILS